MKNLTIKTKVSGAFGAVLTVTILLGLFAVARLAAVNDQAADIRTNWLPTTRALGELSGKTERFRISEANWIMMGQENKATVEANMRKALGMRDKAWAAYEPMITSVEERGLANQIAAEWATYMRAHDQLEVAGAGGQAGRGDQILRR